MYAQLDFSNNRFKRVNLIGSVEVGITPELVEQYPADFVNLESRTDIPADTFTWYYDTETDTFLNVTETPIVEPPVAEPYQPTNAEVAQMISDLQADLIIAGVI